MAVNRPSSTLTIPVHPRPFPAADDTFLDYHPSSARKVKFLCSFGGRLLPRPSDGALRYVGGDTRIIAFRKDVSFSDLMQKMIETNGGPTVLKYQLPDEDLDALVTVSCPEDLENMMEEYEKLAGASPDGSAKLRVFLFSPSELEIPALGPLGGEVEVGDAGQERYVDAMVGVGDLGLGVSGRKESSSEESPSAALDSEAAVDSINASTKGTSSPALQSPTFAHASGLVAPLGVQAAGPFTVQATLGVSPPQTMGPIRTDLLRPPPPPVAATVDIPQAYGHTPVDNFNYPNYHTMDSGRVQYVNPQQLGVGGTPVGYVAVAPQAYAPGLSITTNPSPSAMQYGGGLEPVATLLEPYAEGSAHGGRVFQVAGDQNYTAHQTLSQFQTLPATPQPSYANRFTGSHAWPQVVPLNPVQDSPQAPRIRLEDCMMCHEALPHAHSDTLFQEHDAGSKASAFEANPAFHSLPPEDVTASQALPKVPNCTLPYGIPVGQNIHGAVPMPQSDFYGHSHGTGAQTTPQSDSYGYSYSTNAQSDSNTTLSTIGETFSQSGLLPPYGASGFPTDMQTSYRAPLNYHPPIPYEETVQQQRVPWVVPGQHMVKHDQFINKPAVGGSLAMNGIVQNSGVALNGTGTENSYEYSLPVAGMEAIHLSSETSGISDHRKADTKRETGSPKDMNFSNSFNTIDNSERNTPSSDKKDNFVGPGYVHHEMSSDRTSVRPMDQLPSSTLEVNPLSNIQHEVSSQLPARSDPFDPYSHGIKTEAEPPLPNERLLGPANSGKVLVRDRKGHEPQLHSGYLFPSPNLKNPDLDNRDVRDSKPSASLFSDSDPWKIMQNVEMPPSKHGKVAAEELPIPNDSIFTDDLKTSGILPKSTLVEEESYHQLPDSLDNDPCSDFIEPMKGLSEKQTKQEMQALAEGVAASIIQMSSPQTGVLPATERNMRSPDTDNAQGIIDDNLTSQHVMLSDNSKNEDIDARPPDKLGLASPITEDIERLQIIKNSDLEELRELGSGTFGTVYHGKWRGSDVAIKRINDRCFIGKPSEQDRMRTDFWNEASKLAGLHHPNVVAFYGVVLDGPGGSVATVTEYMANGSLHNALRSSDRPLDRRKRLLIAMDVAFGMEYLHGKNIVHFDLKSDNLLVNLRDPQRPICKVGDLGLSKVKCQTLISGGVRGTLPWMAPELLNGSSSLVSEKVDVFSFGIVMWELLTGEEPYADLHYGAIIGGIVNNTLRPPIPESCDPHWRALMEQCWSSEPSERPSFTVIAAKLRAMAASLSQKGPPQVDSTSPSQMMK